MLYSHFESQNQQTVSNGYNIFYGEVVFWFYCFTNNFQKTEKMNALEELNGYCR